MIPIRVQDEKKPTMEIVIPAQAGIHEHHFKTNVDGFPVIPAKARYCPE
jgi:hypothetical protein